MLATDRLLTVVEREGTELINTVGATTLDRPVPSCAGWTARELTAHIGGVYRWVAAIVGERRARPPSPDERAELHDFPAGDDALLAAVAVAHADVVTVLRNASDELDCWTIWPAASSRAYWIRRQAHESLVHRVDAQNAAADTVASGAALDTVVAADGVDEMVRGFARRYRDRLRSSARRTLSLHAVDAAEPDAWWWIRLGPDEPEFGRGRTRDANPTEVHARSGELLLLLWNRRSADGLAVTGDPDLLDVWRRDAHL